MLILVSGASRTVRRLAASAHLGCLMTPNAGNTAISILELGLPWAADNAAFSGFDPLRFDTMVIRKIHRAVASRSPGAKPPLWVTAPDVVADHEKTLGQFYHWQRRIHLFDLPVAFVAQDGATPETIPWAHLEAVFIGGSTEWKIGKEAERIVAAAKRAGKLVHMGRVNTKSRLKLAHEWGVDSVDGTAFSMYPDTKLPTALGWIEEMEARRERGRAGHKVPAEREETTWEGAGAPGPVVEAES